MPIQCIILKKYRRSNADANLIRNLIYIIFSSFQKLKKLVSGRSFGSCEDPFI